MGRKKYIAEFLGTFTLVFVGAGCVCANSYLVKAGSPGFGLLGIAIAFGVVVVAIAYSLGYISGAHINPAVYYIHGHDEKDGCGLWPKVYSFSTRRGIIRWILVKSFISRGFV